MYSGGLKRQTAPVAGHCDALTDEFSLGLALRMGFATMATDMPFDPGTGPMRVDESMSGFGFPGVSVGANYRPTEQLSLAVNYRSKMTMDISGEGTASSPAFGSQSLDVESEWSTPHSFGIGAAYEIVPKRLLVATDLRYALLDDAVNDLNMTIEMQGQSAPIESALSLQWKDSLVRALGAEYRVTDWMPLRAGYGLTTSATAEDHATALTPAPGLLQSLHVGAGIALSELQFDLGAAYGFGSSEVASTVNGPTGTYGTDFFMFALSATYRPESAPEAAPAAYSMAK